MDLGALRMERAALAGMTRSAATQRAYAADWGDFSRWCVAAGRSVLPASADTVGLYVVDQARRLTAATVARRLSAIAERHAAAGYASPVTAEVREVMAGIRRKLGTAPCAKAALSVDELRQVLEAVPAGVAGVRDRALLLLGFASSLRRSELAALQVDDVTFLPEGVVLFVGRSKTDQEGAGREVGVHRGRRPSTCPARALAAWLAVRGEWPGPVFCRVMASGELRRSALSGAAVADVVKGAVSRVGLDPARYGGHSLRAGCATAAAGRGADVLAIQNRTGHASARMVRRYVRHASLFAVDPLKGLL